jgi:Lar family restriction alleviation protein
MSDELKPCPFCGKSASIKVNHSVGGMGGEGWLVWCDTCGAEGTWDLGKSGAIESWNTRPLEDAFRDALEKVSRALRREIETTNALNAEIAVLTLKLSEAERRAEEWRQNFFSVLARKKITISEYMTMTDDGKAANDG